MNWLQIGETWVDMDRVYSVKRENHRDYTETKDRFAYRLSLYPDQTVLIHEADAAPLLAWLDTHRAKPVTGLPEGFPELTQEQAEKIAEAFQAFKNSGAWELLKK